MSTRHWMTTTACVAALFLAGCTGSDMASTTEPAASTDSVSSGTPLSDDEMTELESEIAEFQSEGGGEDDGVLTDEDIARLESEIAAFESEGGTDGGVLSDDEIADLETQIAEFESEGVRGGTLSDDEMAELEAQIAAFEAALGDTPSPSPTTD